MKNDDDSLIHLLIEKIKLIDNNFFIFIVIFIFVKY